MGNKVHVDRWRLNVPPEVESVYDAAMALQSELRCAACHPTDAGLSGAVHEYIMWKHQRLAKAIGNFDAACLKYSQEVEHE